MNQVQMAPLTPVVKKLLIAIVATWVFFQLILGHFQLGLVRAFELHPDNIVEKFWIWQLVTYMFLHANSVFHIFFNCLMLWFFGSELEKHWGARFFTIYYFTCGVGAGLIYCLGVALYTVITGNQQPFEIPVVGASGALFGLLVAYGIMFSKRIIYFMGMFPMKAKYFAMIAAAMDSFSLLTTGFLGSEVAYLCHIGGAIVGFLFLWGNTRLKLSKTKSKLKKNTGSLRLVVDNEKLKNENGPKYWN
jgi:membrane associated rhomboid family serine protease